MSRARGRLPSFPREGGTLLRALRCLTSHQSGSVGHATDCLATPVDGIEGNEHAVQKPPLLAASRKGDALIYDVQAGGS